ncbi:MarR family transcriptional regulator [Synechococcus sp. JA-3-3Ab]|uniref:MarR family transcriptional regulator n=1 Tax=Synechococcus sp. (strain JA-3-3Ab) TaxID=321327 RepID=UPI000069427E|nr:MarR family transcriptional regulator [Synechococcus sp. JA-3-3Ab]ABC99216.1 hypothetical protein CYA_1020 [Synechococcus sp. JA-3-3Ab]
MSDLLPKSEILLWKLLLTGEEPTKSQVKPKHRTKELKLLEEKGLIECKTVVEKGRRITRLVLTDKAWDWASTTPPTAIARSKSPEAAVVLQKALATLVDYAQRENVPLARILGLRPRIANRPSLGGAAPVPTGQTQPWEVSEGEVDPNFLEKVFRTCEEMGGRYYLVYLSDLRKRFPDVPSWLLDQALLTLHRQAKIVLMDLDDPLSITPEIKAAAINLYGYDKHVLRVRN